LQLTLVDQHSHQLLDEQGIALAGGQRPAWQIGGYLAVARQLLEKLPALVAAQGLEHDPGDVVQPTG